MPAILPTHRDASPSSSTSSNSDGQQSSDITQVPSRTDEQHTTKRPVSGVPSEAKSKDDSEEGFDDKGLIEVEEDGQKRKVRVVLEHKTGKEMLKEVSGGSYTVPRW